MSVKALQVTEMSADIVIEGEDLAAVCMAGEHQVNARFRGGFDTFGAVVEQ